MSWIEQYHAGERESVWDELRRLEPADLKGELRDAAQLVVDATMARVAENLATIVRRLNSLDYRWAVRTFENKALDRADMTVDEYRCDWTSKREWSRGLLRHVGEIDLAGSCRTWIPSAFVFEDEEWPDFGVYSYPLHLYGVQQIAYVDPATRAILERYLASDRSSRMYLGADATMAAGFSGGCHRITLPASSCDPIVEGIEGRSAPMTLVEYLRWVFDWGGLPGFEAVSDPPPEIDTLRAGLLPI